MTNTWVLMTCALYVGVRVIKEELELRKVFMQNERKNREVQGVPWEKWGQTGRS